MTLHNQLLNIDYYFMKKQLILGALSATLLTSGCVSLEEQTREYAQYSCFDLAREMGKQEAILQEAKDESLGADIALLFLDDDKKDKEKRENAQLSGTFAEWDIDDARYRLDVLKDLSREQDCRS